MAKSKYKEKILEELRKLHAEEELLYKILRECKEEKEDGKDDSRNG